MIELTVNSSHTIDIYVIKNDEPVEADATPTYKIYDADTDVQLASGTAITDPEDIGHYYVEVDSEFTGVDRTLRVEWTYILEGRTINGFEYTVISTPYAEVGEIITELDLGSEPMDYNYFPHSKLRSAERMARLMINNYTGRDFGQKLGAQIVYGNGSDTLIFAERMSAFTKIEQDDEVIYDSELGINTLGYGIVLTETGQGVRITNAAQLDVSEYPASAYLYPPKMHFRNGARFKIYGTLGYPYIPLPIKQACFLLISDLLYNDALWRQKYIAEFDTGNMKVKLRDTAFTGTGNLLADDLLDPYKITGIVVI